jgi:hypothetical protein
VFGLIITPVLSAQDESWTLPGAVMTAVPFGILGALITNWLRGLENDVYFQIGLLVLIGLGAKNAVLRVTAAVEFRHQGHSIMEATRLAGEQRLRPIIMTSLAFAFGCLPLAIALGAGANARHSIGTGIIGGMLGETTLAMLYVPLFFYLFDRLAERKEAKAEPASNDAGDAKEPPAPPLRTPRPGRPTRAGLTMRAKRLASMRTNPPASKLRALAFACLGCAVLAGCMMGPDYARPKVDSPAAFRFEPKEVAETANVEWWKQFGDPVLDQLIAEGLANNYSVKVSAEKVEQALGVITRFPALYPQIGYSGIAERAFSEPRSRRRFPTILNPQTTTGAAHRELGSTCG